jgi:hypothetical protein
MRITQVEYIDIDYRRDLLSRLTGRIFHVTTRAALQQIKTSGAILHNRDERFALNPTSIIGFGRTRGWVCLFDLRNQSVEKMLKELEFSTQYDLLAPDWFEYVTDRFSVWNLAYLFLEQTAWPQLKPNQLADEERQKTGKYVHYIPDIEVWFPGDVPIGLIQEALLVKIQKNAHKDDQLYWAHMWKVAKQNQNQE